MPAVSLGALAFALTLAILASVASSQLGFALTLPRSVPSLMCKIQGNFVISSTPVPSQLPPGRACNGTIYYLNDGITIQAKALFDCQWNFLSRGLEGNGFLATYDLYSSTTPSFANVSQVSLEAHQAGESCQQCFGLRGLAPPRCLRWPDIIDAKSQIKCSMYPGSALQQFVTVDSNTRLLQSFGWSFKTLGGLNSNGIFTTSNCRAMAPPTKLLVPSHCCTGS